MAIQKKAYVDNSPTPVPDDDLALKKYVQDRRVIAVR
jgi:hypothetical protein